VAELADAGVKRISVGGSMARAALGELIRAAEEVRDQGTFTYATRAVADRDAAAYMADT
jgi:2-methylisocitrate lyase-like PEP mutase family enzyme